MKYYNIIIKRGCSYCDMAISLLKEKHAEYVVTDVSNCPDACTAYKKDYERGTVPIIIKHDGDNKVLVGGFDDLEKYVCGTEF